MGYVFEFDEANNTLRVVWDGQLTDEIFLEGIAAARRFVQQQPVGRAINDLSGAKVVDVSTEAIRTLALGQTSDEEANVMVVVVAPSDLAFGLSRMYSVLTEETRPTRRVARTMEEAYELLEIKNPQFRRIEVA